MNIIVIEDEKLSAEHLQLLLKKADKNIQVVATFDTVKKSVEAFQKGLSADLLFVDIHLADGISFDIFTQTQIDFPIVFTTAYDEYAIKAFKLNSVDYLLKPISIDDLKSALVKFNKLNSGVQSKMMENINNVYQNISRQYKTRFMVKMGENIVSVKSEEVNFFISEDGVVLLNALSQKRYVVDFTLDQLETLLDPAQFFRINRKVIVNISAIEKISTYFNSRLKIVSGALENEDTIVSRERVNEFKKWLDN